MKVAALLFATTVLSAFVVMFFMVDEQESVDRSYLQECRNEHVRYEKLRLTYHGMLDEKEEVLEVCFQTKRIIEPELKKAISYLSEVDRQSLNDEQMAGLHKIESSSSNLLRLLNKTRDSITKAKEEINALIILINQIDYYTIFTMHDYYGRLGVDLEQCQSPILK